MNILFKASATAAFVFAAWPSNAQGAMPCGDRTAIVERLNSKYGEARHVTAFSQNSQLMEIFVSEETGTWTVLVTTPDGRSCLVAAGDNWVYAPEVPGEPV